MNRIVLTGIPNDELDVVIDQVCVVLRRNGVDYPILTFEHDPRKVIPVDPHTGQDTSGATCAIDLPPMRQIIANWREILEDLSNTSRHTTISLLVGAEVQVALNGELL